MLSELGDLNDEFLACCMSGTLTDVKYCVSRGANINSREELSGDGALHKVVSGNVQRYEKYPIVEYLLSSGADVNARNNKEETPLHKASDNSLNGPMAMIDLMIKYGADVTLVDSRGRTPLRSCIDRGYLKSASTILVSQLDKSPDDIDVPLPGPFIGQSGIYFYNFIEQVIQNVYCKTRDFLTTKGEPPEEAKKIAKIFTRNAAKLTIDHSSKAHNIGSAIWDSAEKLAMVSEGIRGKKDTGGVTLPDIPSELWVIIMDLATHSKVQDALLQNYFTIDSESLASGTGGHPDQDLMINTSKVAFSIIKHVGMDCSESCRKKMHLHSSQRLQCAWDISSQDPARFGRSIAGSNIIHKRLFDYLEVKEVNTLFHSLVVAIQHHGNSDKKETLEGFLRKLIDIAKKDLSPAVQKHIKIPTDPVTKEFLAIEDFIPPLSKENKDLVAAIKEESLLKLGSAIHRGADVNLRDPSDRGISPLMKVFVNNKCENLALCHIVSLLIARKANIYELCPDQSTLLHLAASGSFEKIAHKLIKAGVEVNSLDQEGNTAMHDAAISGNSGMVDILISNQADPTIKNHNEDTPLLEAVRAAIGCEDVNEKECQGCIKSAISIAQYIASQPHLLNENLENAGLALGNTIHLTEEFLDLICRVDDNRAADFIDKIIDANPDKQSEIKDFIAQVPLDQVKTRPMDGYVRRIIAEKAMSTPPGRSPQPECMSLTSTPEVNSTSGPALG